MAVYKKTYRPYDGALTPSFTRFLVIPRYAFEDMRKSRFLTIFFLASFIYPLIAALIIYVQHNVSALNLLGVQGETCPGPVNDARKSASMLCQPRKFRKKVALMEIRRPAPCTPSRLRALTLCCT